VRSGLLESAKILIEKFQVKSLETFNLSVTLRPSALTSDRGRRWRLADRTTRDRSLGNHSLTTLKHSF
jgi:hypothetical protein